MAAASGVDLPPATTASRLSLTPLSPDQANGKHWALLSNDDTICGVPELIMVDALVSVGDGFKAEGGHNLDDVSTKLVRTRLEERCGLHPMTLKPYREWIDRQIVRLTATPASAILEHLWLGNIWNACDQVRTIPSFSMFALN